VGRLRYALLVVLALLWVGRAQAGTVALLRPTSEAPELNEAIFRLKGELLAVGLAVAVVDRPPDGDTSSSEAYAWLDRTALERGIDAFIDVVGERTPVAVDVWLCERSPRRLRVSRVTLPPDTPNAAATLAIRAIEVLRSSFLAIDLARAEATAVPPAPAAPPAPPADLGDEAKAGATPAALPGWAHIGLAAGAAVLTSLDGVGPSLSPLVRLEWAPLPWLSLQATGAGFGTRPRVETSLGSVQVAQGFATLGACVCRSGDSGFGPVVALAAGALHTAVDGQALPPNVGHDVDSWGFLLDGSFGVRLNEPRRYYLTLASHVQIAQPYVAVHFVDTVVATTGRLNLLLTLTAGAWL